MGIQLSLFGPKQEPAVVAPELLPVPSPDLLSQLPAHTARIAAGMLRRQIPVLVSPPDIASLRIAKDRVYIGDYGPELEGVPEGWRAPSGRIWHLLQNKN